mgnify:CR=1 FL=1
MGKILCLGVEAVVSCTIGAALGGAIRPRTPVGVVCTAIGTYYEIGRASCRERV